VKHREALPYDKVADAIAKVHASDANAVWIGVQKGPLISMV
jgi:hypothetical protein